MAGGKLRACLRCGSYYTTTGAHQKYCPDCRLARLALNKAAPPDGLDRAGPKGEQFALTAIIAEWRLF